MNRYHDVTRTMLENNCLKFRLAVKIQSTKMEKRDEK